MRIIDSYMPDGNQEYFSSIRLDVDSEVLNIYSMNSANLLLIAISTFLHVVIFMFFIFLQSAVQTGVYRGKISVNVVFIIIILKLLEIVWILYGQQELENFAKYEAQTASRYSSE